MHFDFTIFSDVRISFVRRGHTDDRLRATSQVNTVARWDRMRKLIVSRSSFDSAQVEKQPKSQNLAVSFKDSIASIMNIWTRSF